MGVSEMHRESMEPIDLASLASELATGPLSAAKRLGLDEVVVRSSCTVHGSSREWRANLVELIGAFRVRSGVGRVRLEIGRDPIAPTQVRIRLSEARSGSEVGGSPSCSSGFTYSVPGAHLALELGAMPRRPVPRVSLVLGEAERAEERAIANLVTRFGYELELVAACDAGRIDAARGGGAEIGLVDARVPLHEIDAGASASHGGWLLPIPFLVLGRRDARWSVREAILLGARAWLEEPLTSEALHAVLAAVSSGGSGSMMNGLREAVPVIDEHLLHSQSLGCTTLLAKLVDTFDGVGGADIAALLNAISAESPGEAALRAHRIAGAAASIGASSTRELMGSVESRLRDGDLEGASCFAAVGGVAFLRDLHALRHIAEESRRRERGGL